MPTLKLPDAEICAAAQAALNRRHEVLPLEQQMIAQAIGTYHARSAEHNDRAAAARTLHAHAQRLVPGVRVEDAIETAIWAHAACDEKYGPFVVSLYREGRMRVTTTSRPEVA